MSGLVVEALRYGDPLDLGPFSFRVAEHECVGLRGPSGAGKTRLLRALADLDPNEGRVTLGGLVCHETPAPRWRHQIGLLSATPRWWLETVGAHFPRDGARWVQRFGFEPDTLGWAVDRLSSGESQRLAIARLLSRGPRALLLDEPTAHLDEASLRQTEAIIAEYGETQRVPIVWVSHDGDQLRRVADRVLEFVEGRLRECAS